MDVAKEQTQFSVDHLVQTYNLMGLLSEMKELSKLRLECLGLPLENKDDLFSQYAYELSTVFAKNYVPEEENKNAEVAEDPKQKKKKDKKAGGKNWGKGVQVIFDLLKELKKEGKSVMIDFF